MTQEAIEAAFEEMIDRLLDEQTERLNIALGLLSQSAPELPTVVGPAVVAESFTAAVAAAPMPPKEYPMPKGLENKVWETDAEYRLARGVPPSKLLHANDVLAIKALASPKRGMGTLFPFTAALNVTAETCLRNMILPSIDLRTSDGSDPVEEIRLA